jgi:hypothetical protein
MKPMNISSLTQSATLYIHSERSSIETNPEYQRDSDVWTLEKRQLLIDSILNGYDIPKIYFHKFVEPKRVGADTFSFAVIDGKQRLLSIWGFIDGRFPLSESFEYLADSKIDAKGLTYKELGRKYPKLKLKFDSYSLPIVVIETDDIDLIDDMFFRLNEAVPLSAAEKRNAYPGPIPKVIRSLSKDAFFKKCLPFPNKRYRHLDLAAKFLFIQDQGKTVDTKKVYLDAFTLHWKSKKLPDAEGLSRQVRKILRSMRACFVDQDPLLQSVGMVVLYFYLFHIAASERWEKPINRTSLKRFEDERKKNRLAAESDLASADYQLLEFDRLLQTPNDAFATTTRLQVMLKKCFNKALPKGYGALVEPDID